MKRLPTIQQLNEAKEYKTDIGHFSITGYYETASSPDDSYDGHFSVSLFMGDLKWDIKKDWLMQLKKEIGSNADSLVFPGFSHNKITYLYIREKDVDEIWNKTIEVFTKILIK